MAPRRRTHGTAAGAWGRRYADGASRTTSGSTTRSTRTWTSHDQPDPVLAREQWLALVEAIRAAGGAVEVLAQRPDAPDMVYAMNLGLASCSRTGGPSTWCCRTCATPSAGWRPRRPRRWFAEHGFATSYVGRDGVGAHLEAGDVFAFGDALVAGYGPRTEELALKHLATDAGRAGPWPADHAPGDVPPRPGVLPARRAAAPWSARPPSTTRPRRPLLALVPEPLVLTEEEALTVLRELHRAGPHRADAGAARPRVRAQLEELGLRDRAGRRHRVPQGRRLGPLPDQPARRRWLVTCRSCRVARSSCPGPETPRGRHGRGCACGAAPPTDPSRTRPPRRGARPTRVPPNGTMTYSLETGGARGIFDSVGAGDAFVGTWAPEDLLHLVPRILRSRLSTAREPLG